MLFGGNKIGFRKCLLFLQLFTFRTDIDPDNPQHEHYVATLVNSLIQELEAKANTMSEDLFLSKLKLIEAANTFRVCIGFEYSSCLYC